MSDLAEFLEFKLDDKSWKCTRVQISDFGAVREAIRLERVQCAAMRSAPEVQGVLMAQPIKQEEVWDFITSAVGSALVLYNCVCRANQTFTPKMAEQMVMEGHEFVNRLFVESHLLNPPEEEPISSSSDSSPSG